MVNLQHQSEDKHFSRNIQKQRDILFPIFMDLKMTYFTPSLPYIFSSFCVLLQSYNQNLEKLEGDQIFQHENYEDNTDFAS